MKDRCFLSLSLKLQREDGAMWDHAYGREARCDQGVKIRWSHRGIYTRASAEGRASEANGVNVRSQHWNVY